jgi:hypothetical protein
MGAGCPIWILGGGIAVIGAGIVAGGFEVVGAGIPHTLSDREGS